MTPEEVLVLYGRAWFERDRDKRIEALRRACTDDVRYVGPDQVVHGLEAFADMIGRFSEAPMAESADSGGEEHSTGMSRSGLSVEVVTPIESVQNFYRYSYFWKFPDGSRVGGTSFCERAEDGRIKLVTVWPGTRHFPIPGIDPGAQ